MKIVKISSKIWLDDIRPIPEEYDYWCKTVDEAKAVFNSEKIDFISFDNDLGEGIPEGRDLANWIEERAYNKTLPKLDWQVHSANPEGASAISKAMLSAERFWEEE